MVCTSSSLLLLLAHLISNTILFVHIVTKLSVNTDELRVKGLDWMKIEFALTKAAKWCECVANQADHVGCFLF